MIDRIFERLEQVPLSFNGWVLGLLGITFIRTFLENFSGRSSGASFSTDVETILHYTLFYFATVLALLIIIHLFSKKPVIAVSRIVLFGTLIIWLPPVIDIVITLGKGHQLGYLFTAPHLLVESFLTYVLYGLPGISIGIRIEFLIIFAITFSYIYSSTRNVTRSALAVFMVYSLLFILYAIPNFIGITPDYTWLLRVEESLVGQFYPPTSTFFTSVQRSFEMHFNIVVSQIFYLALIPIMFCIAYRWKKSALVSVLKNSRLERVLHYFAMIVLGIVLAYHAGLVTVGFEYWFDYTSIFILFFIFYSAWMYAVGQNDIVDLTSDKISNSSRPLVTGVLTVEETKIFNIVFLCFAVCGGYLIGQHALYMTLVFIALSHVYSNPPLQLKRFVFVNSFIVSLATLSAALAGFFMLSSDARISAFPGEWALLTVLMYTLLANIKDIKDFEGDKAVGVHTLLVLFGLERGKRIIAVMSVIALALVPIVSGIAVLWYPFFPAAVASWTLITRAHFREKYLFTLYFLYIILCYVSIPLF